jgi:hypothetical protein
LLLSFLSSHSSLTSSFPAQSAMEPTARSMALSSPQRLKPRPLLYFILPGGVLPKVRLFPVIFEALSFSESIYCEQISGSKNHTIPHECSRLSHTDVYILCLHISKDTFLFVPGSKASQMALNQFSFICKPRPYLPLYVLIQAGPSHFKSSSSTLYIIIPAKVRRRKV